MLAREGQGSSGSPRLRFLQSLRRENKEFKKLKPVRAFKSECFQIGLRGVVFGEYTDPWVTGRHALNESKYRCHGAERARSFLKAGSDRP